MNIGHQIRRYTRVSSTNDLAWNLAGDAAMNGVLFLTEEQIAGRGRRGDLWVAPPGSSLLLSILLHPPATLNRPVILTLWATLGICQVLEHHLNLRPHLKWPNDIMIAGKKVCGVLVEQRQGWCVVGIGLNVNFPDNWQSYSSLPNAAALSDFIRSTIDRESLLQQLLIRWNSDYDRLAVADFTAFNTHWQNYSQLTGRFVELEAAGKTFQGHVHSMGHQGIDLKTNGALHHFVPESISRITIMDSGQACPG